MQRCRRHAVDAVTEDENEDEDEDEESDIGFQRGLLRISPSVHRVPYVQLPSMHRLDCRHKADDP